MNAKAAPIMDVKLLHSAIEEMKRQSQDGFSRIKALALLSLHRMESPLGPFDVEALAGALESIVQIAGDSDNNISCEAEDVGCNYIDPAWRRRLEARSFPQDVAAVEGVPK